MELTTLPDGSENADVGGSMDTVLFGVVLPVHDEEDLVPAALASIDRAFASVSDRAVSLGIVIVLDACSDRSGQLVAEWRHRHVRRHGDQNLQILTSEVGSVGHARMIGCAALLRHWADYPLESIWLATSDADSEVPQDWIAAQLKMRREGSQLWVGPVSVRDWSGRSAGTAEAWRFQYEAEALPIHGANFGIDAATYVRAGGFAGLPTGEDRDLFERAVAQGAVVRHDAKVRVVTSGRRRARAPDGFAHALSSIEATIATPAIADQLECGTW